MAVCMMQAEALDSSGGRSLYGVRLPEDMPLGVAHLEVEQGCFVGRACAVVVMPPQRVMAAAEVLQLLRGNAVAACAQVSGRHLPPFHGDKGCQPCVCKVLHPETSGSTDLQMGHCNFTSWSMCTTFHRRRPQTTQQLRPAKMLQLLRMYRLRLQADLLRCTCRQRQPCSCIAAC